MHAFDEMFEALADAVANPRGYFSKGEQTGFVERHVVTVPLGRKTELDQEQRHQPA